jgi:hypothetical protein
LASFLSEESISLANVLSDKVISLSECPMERQFSGFSKRSATFSALIHPK